jgi:hypothetical protein
MSGIGFTDQTEVQPSQWNKLFVSYPQVVEFKMFDRPDDPDSARIPWNEPGPLASSQCDGDSGGPVFVVGQGNVPIVIGVLSAAKGVTASSVSCGKSKNAEFVNLGHPFVNGMLCPELQRAGIPCQSTLNYVPVTIAKQ